MRVGFEFNNGLATGINRYCHNLLREFGGSAGLGPTELETFSYSRRDPRPAWLPPRISYHETWVPGRVQLFLNREIGLAVERLYNLPRLELLHVTNMAPLASIAPQVVTVYDVAWRQFGADYHSITGPAWIENAERTISRARHLCAISEVTAAELKKGGVVSRRITVTPLGVDDRFRDIDPQAASAVRLRYGLPDQYLLSMGAINVRKNPRALSAALRAMKTAPPLVLAGPPPPEGLGFWGFDGLDVRHLGYVPEEDVPALYHAATALVFVSLAEGFGLPLLEGLAAGVPVIASDIPIFREVGGDAPLFIDPNDPNSIAEAIGQIFETKAAQDERVARGRKRAAGFTWRTCAEATACAYQKALQR